MYKYIIKQDVAINCPFIMYLLFFCMPVSFGLKLIYQFDVQNVDILILFFLMSGISVSFFLGLCVSENN